MPIIFIFYEIRFFHFFLQLFISRNQDFVLFHEKNMIFCIQRVVKRQKNEFHKKIKIMGIGKILLYGILSVEYAMDLWSSRNSLHFALRASQITEIVVQSVDYIINNGLYYNMTDTKLIVFMKTVI